jgi:four helix bundle protein
VGYKFEKLDVWQRAIEYTDLIYEIADQLPRSEEYNLKSQITRAANGIALNIAEGSTGLSDAEQSRFLQIAIRSLLETVACLHLIQRREYVGDIEYLREAYRFSEPLFAQFQAFRASLEEKSSKVSERILEYGPDTPFE